MLTTKFGWYSTPHKNRTYLSIMLEEGTKNLYVCAIFESSQWISNTFWWVVIIDEKKKQATTLYHIVHTTFIGHDKIVRRRKFSFYFHASHVSVCYDSFESICFQLLLAIYTNTHTHTSTFIHTLTGNIRKRCGFMYENSAKWHKESKRHDQ